MGNTTVMALADEARLHPGRVMANLEALGEAERARILDQALAENHTPYRRYTPDPEEAVLQLVANEYVAPPDEQRWKSFFVSKNPAANLFHLQYVDVWTHVTVLGKRAFFSEPRMLTYVLQTVSQPNNPVSLFKTVPTSEISQQKNLPIPVLGQIPLFVCGAMEMVPGAASLIADEMRWLSEQGYQWPGAIMVKPGAGGSRQTDREPCEGLPILAGSHLRIGAVAGRMSCTLRHEDMHEVWAQQSEPVIERVNEIYVQAMEADFGLIFNDEYYMRKFLHAGHPMQNANEFFASAAHAFTHHADDMVALIQTSSTPQSVRTYAIAMWRLLRDDVFHGKVFTQDGQDPFL